MPCITGYSIPSAGCIYHQPAGMVEPAISVCTCVQLLQRLALGKWDFQNRMQNASGVLSWFGLRSKRLNRLDEHGQFDDKREK
jgi:hypothetical protein